MAVGVLGQGGGGGDTGESSGTRQSLRAAVLWHPHPGHEDHSPDDLVAPLQASVVGVSSRARDRERRGRLDTQEEWEGQGTGAGPHATATSQCGPRTGAEPCTD